jgi:hypothetical protein
MKIMKIYLIKDNPIFLSKLNSIKSKDEYGKDDFNNTLNKIYLLKVSDFNFEDKENLKKKSMENSEAKKIDLKNTFNPYRYNIKYIIRVLKLHD